MSMHFISQSRQMNLNSDFSCLKYAVMFPGILRLSWHIKSHIKRTSATRNHAPLGLPSS